jgi:hypothetical protein
VHGGANQQNAGRIELRASSEGPTTRQVT